MKYSFFFSLLFLIAFSSCKKENDEILTFPYVNLKYPAVGQISKYKHFRDSLAFEFCEATPTGDTIIVEIFEETINGFLLGQYLSDYSNSRFDTEGTYFNNRMDTLFVEINLQNDTLFSTKFQNDFQYLFAFDAIPLMKPDTVVSQGMPCIPLFFNMFASQLIDLTRHSVKDFITDNQVYHNVVCNSQAFFGGMVFHATEVCISSYHHVIKSSTFSQIFPENLVFESFELITE